MDKLDDNEMWGLVAVIIIVVLLVISVTNDSHNRNVPLEAVEDAQFLR